MSNRYTVGVVKREYREVNVEAQNRDHARQKARDHIADQNPGAEVEAYDVIEPDAN